MELRILFATRMFWRFCQRNSGNPFQLHVIPGLCIRIHNMSYSQPRAFLVPSPGEQRFERVFSPFVASSFQRTRLFL